MGVAESMRRVCELVESTTPASGQRFLWLDPDRGAAPALEDVHEGPDRIFELRLVSTSDDGQAGCIPARLRVETELRIRYRAAGSRMGLAVVAAEDARLLRDALMFAPSSWQGSTTGLLNVLAAPSSLDELPGPGQTAPSHMVSTIPLTLEVDP